ncbi:metal ABC transporter solute-binding protein, Zn/Mn family [Haloparvum sedimenti]|uniref:metal ABC transporter solute-binding protein, Zn/Mn family n=1 Tax=Haloparvum sedimenti TaxID=1678448 RepID=UPI00071E89E3|nr:zinc ABC transporter substrate-binding protein [Haloparvum sedimenti]
MTHSRRDVLRATAGTLGVGALAGCTERLERVAGTSELEDGAYAAFFTLADFARQVGGDAFPVENPVPAGTMGHRWEPGPDLATEVVSHQAFVYMDVPGFQRWARNTAATIESDHPEVALVDVLDGVDLLALDGDSHDDHTEDGHADEHTATQEHTEDGHDDHDHTEETHDEHTEGDHDDHENTEDGHDEHEHGDYDPHFWVDPVHAAESVETIVSGFQEADPDNAAVFSENGDAYVERLTALHEAFEAGLADRERDTVVVAAHNSYAYLADRYGLEVVSPQGVSPDAEPSQDEISAVVDLIDSEGIDVVLADHFGSDDLANTVVRESSASRVEYLSPAEGTTQEWNERGWGYVEQMEEVNLPALQAAVGITE